MNLAIYLAYNVLTLYIWLIVARALLSWFHLRPGSVLYGLQSGLFTLTEPYLALFRRRLPPGRFGSVVIDWSSLLGLVVLLVALQVLGRL